MRSVLRVVAGALIVGLFASGAPNLRDLGSTAPAPAEERAAQARPEVTGPRSGYDPLSAEEQQRALSAARGAPAVASRLAAAPRTEVLLVERHEEEKAVYARGSWPRRADVYIYDYGKDALIHTVVDLKSGEAETVRADRGIQLPLTRAEMRRALEIALGDGRTGPAIRGQFRQTSGALLRGADQLRGQGLVFRAASQPDQARGAAAACGVHRCVQLMLSTPDGAGLPILPVVDLSTGKPVELGSRGGSR